MRMWCARRWLGLLGFVVAVGGVLGGIAPAQQGLIPEELVVGMVPSRAATILQPPPSRGLPSSSSTTCRRTGSAK
jgi:hypothetical protein